MILCTSFGPIFLPIKIQSDGSYCEPNIFIMGQTPPPEVQAIMNDRKFVAGEFS
jgi:hypothetical protein